MMKLEKFITKRYLIAKHIINFITIISFISIVGVTIGVDALIVVLSVFNGFGSLVTKYLMNFEPHIRVQVISEEGEKNIQQLSFLLSELKEIEGFTPFVSGKVLAFNKGLTKVVNLKGIEKDLADNVYNFSSSILYGNDDIAFTKPVPYVIIGI